MMLRPHRLVESSRHRAMDLRRRAALAGPRGPARAGGVPCRTCCSVTASRPPVFFRRPARSRPHDGRRAADLALRDVVEAALRYDGSEPQLSLIDDPDEAPRRPRHPARSSVCQALLACIDRCRGAGRPTGIPMTRLPACSRRLLAASSPPRAHRAASPPTRRLPTDDQDQLARGLGRSPVRPAHDCWRARHDLHPGFPPADLCPTGGSADRS